MAKKQSNKEAIKFIIIAGIVYRDLNSAININTSGHGEINAFGDTIRPSEMGASVVELGNYRENA